jgi:hypothetical protein
MLTSNERKDYILRMIAELRRLVDALMGKVLRTTSDIPEVLSLISRLRAQVDPASLLPRHRDALAEITGVE